MRVLITGGAGFIGTALANRLAADGHHVRVLDDLSAGDPANLHGDVVFTRGRARPAQAVDAAAKGGLRISPGGAWSVQESVLYPANTTTSTWAARSAWRRRRAMRGQAAGAGLLRDGLRATAPPARHGVCVAAPAGAIRCQQAGSRTLCLCARHPQRHRDGRAAHLQRIWAGPAHPAGARAGHPHFLRNVLTGALARRPRGRHPDARLRVHRRCGGRARGGRDRAGVDRKVINVAQAKRRASTR